MQVGALEILSLQIEAVAAFRLQALHEGPLRIGRCQTCISHASLSRRSSAAWQERPTGPSGEASALRQGFAPLPANAYLMAAPRQPFWRSKAAIWRQLAEEIGGDFVDGGFFREDKVEARAGEWTV